MIAVIRRHPVISYFVVVYLISASAFGLGILPRLVRGEAVTASAGLVLFPAMVIGVALTGLGLTALVDGSRGLGALRARLGRWRIGSRWYLPLLLPPALILGVLLVLRHLVSPVFTPNLFPIGLLIGLVAGSFEEIGWTGYAYPRMVVGHRALPTGLALGVLWGLWHLPVIDFLGAASPHGAAWLPFAAAFIALVTAMRGLIVWLYTNTGSVLLVQLMHASSTGFLAMLSPADVTPAQEAFWYALYAATLWIALGIITAIAGPDLRRPPHPTP